MERRGKKRFGVRGSTVRCRRDTLLAFLKAPTARHFLLNISESGLCFLGREPVPEGERLAFVVEAPGLEAPIEARGRVVRCRPLPHHAAFAVAAEFAPLHHRSLEALRSVLAKAVLDQLDPPSTLILQEIERS
jgi:hypothetical protein